jgi:alpha-N-arabinofuranosidase
MLRELIYTFLISAFFSLGLSAQTKISVIANKPFAEVQPTMWGIFFEDINFAADGGLYAELVKNRSFQFDDPLMGWKVPFRDSVRIINETVGQRSHRFLRLPSLASGMSNFIQNEGYRGMGIHAGEEYRLSVSSKIVQGHQLTLSAELLNAEGKVIGSGEIRNLGFGWTWSEIMIKAHETASKGSLRISLNGKGSVDLDYISLFPVNTYKNRKNGLRNDLVRLLAGLQPGFIRFPGGCIVEGHHLDLRYQWKKTVGPVKQREPIINRWNTEFMHRHTPDYYQSFGLGFFEYFLLAEDLGAEPLPILNCGMACQYNTGELVPLEEMQPYIDDALDLIEFANGNTDSKWGRLRAEMGHSEPFNLKFLGIGNEQWGEQYVERYSVIAEKVHEKYPEIRLVSGAGPGAEGERFDYLWKELQTKQADLIDEHYYQDPQWFFKNAGRYDGYDRTGLKVFAGEYASHTRVKNDEPTSNNNWLSALSEAAFMTGLERNAAVVHMASYAPLFAHVDAWQWRPDLIWFDNLKALATPNYYVQKVFSTHRGTHVVPALLNQQPITGEDDLYASATTDQNKREIYLKVVNASAAKKEILIGFEGKKLDGKEVKITTLRADDLMSFNTLEEPDKIVPVEGLLPVRNNAVNITMEPQSLVLIQAGYK